MLSDERQPIVRRSSADRPTYVRQQELPIEKNTSRLISIVKYRLMQGRKATKSYHWL